jgi:hypothetical protein
VIGEVKKEVILNMTRRLKLGWGEKPDSETQKEDVYAEDSYKGYSVYWTSEVVVLASPFSTEYRRTYLIRPDGATFCVARPMFIDTIREYIDNKNPMEWYRAGVINGFFWKRLPRSTAQWIRFAGKA